QAVGCACVGHDIVLVTPFTTKDLRESVVIGNRRNSIIGMVCRHNRVSSAIYNRSLERRHPRSPHLSLASVYWAGVETLLRHTEAYEMLDHGAHVPRLESFDIAVSHLPSQESVLSVGFLN